MKRTHKGLGERVAHLMWMHDTNRKNVAKELYMDYARFCGVLRGDRVVTVEEVETIAEYFDVTPEFIAWGVGVKNEHEEPAKRGEWIEGHFTIACPHCGTIVDDDAMFGSIRDVPNVPTEHRMYPKYCPWCGARNG